MNNMTLKTKGDQYVIVTRRFATSGGGLSSPHGPETSPAVDVRSERWTVPVCINEAKPGGKIRYQWANGKGYTGKRAAEVELFVGNMSSIQ